MKDDHRDYRIRRGREMARRAFVRFMKMMFGFVFASWMVGTMADSGAISATGAETLFAGVSIWAVFTLLTVLFLLVLGLWFETMPPIEEVVEHARDGMRELVDRGRSRVRRFRR